MAILKAVVGAALLLVSCASNQPPKGPLDPPDIKLGACPSGASWILARDKSFMGCMTPDEQPHGSVLLYYPSGTRHSYNEYVRGRPQGRQFTWYESGQPQVSGQIEDGCSSGLWAWWYENGNRRKTITFAPDGAPHGEFREYFENGQPKREGQWSHGRPVGDWSAWNEAGEPTPPLIPSSDGLVFRACSNEVLD